MAQDYYQTLGVAKEANADDIRKAYRKLARKHHPDLNPGDKAAEDRFKKVQEAYDILSDPKKKQMYDQVGFYSENGMPSGAGPGTGGREQGPHMGFGGFDFSDVFTRGAGSGAAGAGAPRGGGSSGTGSGNFQDIFSQWFGRQHGEETPVTPEKGTDLEYGLNIDFWQAIRGTQVRLNITRQESCPVCGGTGERAGANTICPECSGSGKVNQQAGAMRFSLTCPRCEGTGRLTNRCSNCGGDGRVSTTESVEVRIPPGAQQGSRLRVVGKGNAGTMGGAAGDLYITVRVEPHPFFRRQGDDIEITVPVRIDEAGLGAKIEVPTIDGRALLKIPQGTHNGQKFRLREKGVLNSRSGKRGDQIVDVQVQAPVVQDERTKELLREYAQLHPEDPRGAIWAEV
ncbi:MAG TPA: DnaJ C-terminal domain-containing protein [Bryobacteraceae bacterium]|jgi:molecular chaperone DnaJ